MSDKPLNVDLSNQLAGQINSKPRQPFNNAYRAVLATKGAVYVQGFLAIATRPNKPAEHAWIELEDSIVDPNLPHLHKKLEELHYVPAQRLSAKQLKAAIEEAKEDYPEDDPLPIYGAMPYEYYGDVMLGGKDYQQAYEAAIAKAKELQRHLSDRN